MITFYPWPALTGTVAATQSGTWDVGTVGTITNPVTITDGGGSITVDGSVTVTGTVAVSGTVPVSGTVAATQSGVWTVTIGSITGVMNCIGPQLPDDPLDGYRPLAIGGRASDEPPTVDANGDAVWAWFDLGGRLAIFDGGQTLSVDDGGGSITVDGSVSITGTATVTGTVGVSGTVTVGTHAVTQSGTWTVTQSGTWNVGTVTTVTSVTTVGTITNVVHVDDNGGSLTVDGTVNCTQSGTWNVGTVTTLGTITNVVHVDDNSGSLTVDAPVGTPVYVRLSDGSAAITTLPVSLASVPTHAVTQSGTWTVTADTELPAAAALADAQATPTTPTVGGANLRYNGATWDFERNNVDGTALASAARTATTTSGALTNHNGRGVMVYLNITVAGTGNLLIRIVGKDPTSGVNFLIVADSATTTTSKTRVIYPGVSAAAPGDMIDRLSANLPRVWAVTIVHSDSSSWTYSVGYTLLP